MSPEADEESQPPPNNEQTIRRRERAPTINIDTSAVNGATESAPSAGGDRAAPLPRLQTNVSETEPQHSGYFTASPTELRASPSFERESRPTSPHNVSSLSSKWAENGHNFLSVPHARSRGNSMDSEEESHGTSYGGLTHVPSQNSGPGTMSRKSSHNNDNLTNDDKALEPHPGTEADFEVENNKFAFSPGQLNKLINPKSLAAFHALGGLDGLEKGLRTNRSSGLSVDETLLDGTVSFDEAVRIDLGNADPDMKPMKRTTTSGTMGPPVKDSDQSFSDRKRIYKDNRLPERKAKTIWQLAWMAYNDKVLILLSVAAVISLALGIYQSVRPTDNEARVEWVEGVAIIVAILIVVVVGALNDYQKERQFVKLNKKKEERFVKVIRSGKSREISVHEVLVGDVMHLEPGDLIPVDGIFIDGHNVHCDESSATGESDILRKTPSEEVYRAIENNENISKMDPFILSGGKVTEGVGTFLVTSVGVNSSYGKIMMSLQDEGQTTPLQSKLNVLAEYIAKLGLAAGLLLFIVTFIKFLAKLHELVGADGKGQAFLQIFIVSVTIVVVAVPEGLPLAVTLALAFATTRMLKDNNLVRLLRACETMGNATTICSDKTGTLTQNKMTVVAGTLGTTSRFGDKQKIVDTLPPDANGKAVAPAISDDVSPTECVSTLGPEVKQLLKDSITLNSTAFEAEEDGRYTFIGSKTETALLSFAKDYLGLDSVSEERSNAQIVQMVPFDSGRKCMAVVIKLPNGKYRMLVKGASEILIAHCTKIIHDPTKNIAETPLTEQNARTLAQLVQNYASRSLRTIGLLYRDFDHWPPRGVQTLEEDKRQASFDKVFRDMTFLALVGIQDPLRSGVTDAVKACVGAGVFVRMVTGDNVMTAKAIAQECGIFTPGGIAIEGPVFRKLSKNQMNQIIPRLQVLARSSPEDKQILVTQLKKMGETVAVTGDGTNDAPALKAADVGFSMGIAGTEVAKEASAIILMDDNFASIVKAISWGRVVNDAVKKFLQFQITVNITAVILTFVSAVASGTETSVLSAVQLLWVNLIMDTFAALALATDPPTPSLLKRRPEPKSAPLITVTMWKMITGQSIYQLVVTLVLNFAGDSILNYDGTKPKQLQTLVFNTFVWMQIFNQYNCRRLDNHFNIFEGMFRNYWFLGIQAIIVGGQILIVFVGGAAFAVTPLDGAQWGISLILGLISIPIAVIIRLIPDDVIRRFIPKMPHRKDSGPRLLISDEETAVQEWNPALEEIRDELTFLKKVRGGRMAGLAYKLQHPTEVFKPRSRSPSRSRSNSSLPRTPENEQAPTELTSGPPTPESRQRRRTRSNSGFGPAAAMVGIIAGGIAGGFSPIDGRPNEGETARFTRGRAHSGLDQQQGIEVHPNTAPDDPIIAELPLTGKIPPSQNPDLAPHFEGAPPVPHLRASSSRGRFSHSRHSSTAGTTATEAP